MCITPLGFCLRVIVNKKRLNLKKRTISVLSVLLLIYMQLFFILMQTLRAYELDLKYSIRTYTLYKGLVSL